jgi:hypothetical protein
MREQEITVSKVTTLVVTMEEVEMNLIPSKSQNQNQTQNRSLVPILD